MASIAPNNLPILYNDLVPLNRNQHGNFKIRKIDGLERLATVHAVPLTIDEFAMAQRHFPIVFSAADNALPIALMGLHEGTNTFFTEEGRVRDANLYVPAYLRRFPFLLARLSEESDELSLCFDPTADVIGEDVEGEPLFDGDEPSEATKAVLQFCEQFEQAANRTQAFMGELAASNLLMEGEVAIQPEGVDQPFIYRGFKMVDEEKLHNLRGDELRKLNQNGMLPLIMAHLFSLSVIREVFGRQVMQGTGPVAAPQPVPAEA
jgi:hypothetical protein